VQETTSDATLLTLDQVAARLGVHVKTARRYVRDGRLRAVRIGKRYRIAAAEVALLTGQVAAVPAADSIRRERHVEASTVVQIDAISSEDAQRVMNGVGGAIKGRDKSTDTPLRVDTVYDASRGRLKVIVTGSLATTQTLLGLVALYAG
jgi:excisionase family DNA binding protein